MSTYRTNNYSLPSERTTTSDLNSSTVRRQCSSCHEDLWVHSSVNLVRNSEVLCSDCSDWAD